MTDLETTARVTVTDESNAAGRRYQVSAQTVSGGTATATVKSATIGFDASAGQSDTIPGPADLLTAAFAACVLKNVERVSQILPFSYRWATIDEPDQRMALLHTNIRPHGTIYNTLGLVCDVTGAIVAGPSVVPEPGPTR